MHLSLVRGRLALALAGGLALAGLASHAARADDPKPAPEWTLERADRLEREGRELLERGERVDGARRMAEAWHVRAEVFAREARAAGAAHGLVAGTLPSPESAEARAEQDRLRKELRDAESALGEATRSGDRGVIVEATTACEAARARLAAAQARAEQAARVAKEAADADRAAKVAEQVAHLRQESATAERRAKEYAAAGDEKAAAEQTERSKQLAQKADAIAAGREGGRGLGDGPGAVERRQLAEEVRRLRERVDSLAKTVEELRREVSERLK
jgi:hypothetical protein